MSDLNRTIRGGSRMLLRKNNDIAIEQICLNPEQPRKIFQEAELLELRDSIREFGVLQPVIVKKDKYGLYILIAGERRVRAAKLAGLTKIPAIVKDTDEKDAALIALVENVQRENLNYIEEAYAYKKLIDDYGLSQGDIARRVGKQQSTISNKIRLLNLPPDIREVLAKEHLTERHARVLLKLPDEDVRKSVLERIIHNGLNVKQSEKLVDEILIKKEEEFRKANKIKYINYKIYINSIKKVFSEINEIERGAVFTQEDKGEFIEVKITIPKNEKKNTWQQEIRKSFT
jgi:ParB family chromosome partitioning protein